MPEVMQAPAPPQARSHSDDSAPKEAVAASAPSIGLVVDPAVRRLRVAGIAACLAMLLVVLPVLHLAGVVSDGDLNRLGRYLCFAIAALGVDLIWGYTGMLSLCQAVFFCLGGYAMAMHLALPEGGGDVRPEYNNIPQFLFFANPDSRELPGFWEPFRSLPVTLIVALGLPMLAATVLGFFIFRSRVRGVYFAIITQALAWGVFLAFNRNEMLLGGTNGLTNFYKPLNGQSNWILGLYLATAVALVGCFVATRHVTRSRLGRVLVAVRDKEMRLYFAGYRPELYKVFAFAAGAVLAAIGGILYVPQTGIITPNTMRLEDSIILVVCVALGGRGRLWGAVFGALMFFLLQSTLTTDLPRHWPFIVGLAIVSIVLFLPGGLVTLWTRLEERVASRAGWPRIALAATPIVAIAMFIVPQSLDLMPDAFNVRVLGDVHLKYVLLGAVLLGSAGLEWWSSGMKAAPGLSLFAMKPQALPEAK